MNALVVYCTMTGNTEMIADSIKEEIGADIVKIESQKEFVPKNASSFMRAGFLATACKTIDIKPVKIDLDKYDFIFLGAPVWAWNVNPFIRSFVEKNKEKIKEKRIALFVCCSGSGNRAIKKYGQFFDGFKLLGTSRYQDPKKNDPEKNKKDAANWATNIIQTATKN